MSDEKKFARSIIDRGHLPPQFPTNRHSADFWEQLGRAIATFGFLEEILGKAIFAFTATKKYSPEEVNEAYSKWLPSLERALTDQLYNLAVSYERAVQEKLGVGAEKQGVSRLNGRNQKGSQASQCFMPWFLEAARF